MRVEPVAVIGAGPAGLAASIQLKRYGIAPYVFESGNIGGLLNNSGNVENYPGFPEGITGPELIQRIEKQIANLGISITNDAVTSLDIESGNFILTTQTKNYRFRYVLMASGTKPKKLPAHLSIPEEDRRISYDIRHLMNISGYRIIIIGAGDAAFDMALTLAKHNEIIILGRSEIPSCLPLLADRVAEMAAITYCRSALILRVDCREERNLKITYSSPAGESFTIADRLVIAVGREPQRDYLTGSIIKEWHALESAERIFQAGDI
ncbi:NAD(P)/FAD-dependent oxidoreductase, partial [bacterium]|nr:NAD(P)/FAD-dependent oxidoreductase [candidate division CSSED10-310 bacterium]